MQWINTNVHILKIRFQFQRENFLKKKKKAVLAQCISQPLPEKLLFVLDGD